VVWLGGGLVGAHFAPPHANTPTAIRTTTLMALPMTSHRVFGVIECGRIGDI
jgi:hypothetical protein